MRTFRLLAVLVTLVALASPAWAGSINIIFDPPPTLPVGTLDIIGPNMGSTFSVEFGSCTTNPAIPEALQGYAGCLAFLNETGAPITNINLAFTIPSGSPLIGQTLNCTSLDTFLSSNTCSAAGILAEGQMVSVDFNGGDAIPNYGAFFFAEDSLSLPPLNVSVPAYDPNTLVQLAAGIALMAAFAVRRSA